jgi:hypothetical protein
VVLYLFLLVPVDHAVTPFSYAQVSRVARANGRSVGDYTLTVFGLNFGATNLNARARFGTACVSTTWLADTALRCSLAAGMGTEIPVVLTVADSDGNTQRRSTASGAFSYDTAVPGSWTFWEIGPPYPYNHPAATGGGSISVIGINFGNADYSNRAVIGGSACQVTHWRSDTVLTVKLPAGVGRGLSAVVELPSGIFSRPVLSWFTYGAPIITARHIASDLPPFNDNGRISNSPTPGNVTVTMSGFNFGRTDYSSRSRVGGTVSYRTDWLSDTQVSIVIPPGICNNVEVSLTVARQVDTHTRAWSYDAPRISPEPADPNHNTVIPPNSPTTGGTTLTLFGANFGVFGYSGNGKYGGTSAEASRWKSDSSTALKSPAGVGGSLPVAYIVCGRETIPLPGQQRVSYNLPIVTDHTPHNGPTAGRTTITLFGSNFGKADYSPRAALGTFANKTLMDEGGSIYDISGATACLTTRWNSETSTSCRLPPGAGVQYGVALTVGVQVGTQQTVNFFSYDSPSVVHVLPTNGPAFVGENVTLRIGDAYSAYSVTVLGRNFGMADYSPKVRLGDTDCMAVRWLSDTSTVCKIPGGAGKGVSISVTLQARNNGTQFGVGAKFSYDAPAISNIHASMTFVADVSCSGCSCAPSYHKTSGTISDGPEPYEDNAECKWLISSTAEISLSFTSFDTEPWSGGALPALTVEDYDSLLDYVIINRCTSPSCDPSTVQEVARLSGPTMDLSTVYKSSTGYLQVVFISDGSNPKPYAGFDATWNISAPVGMKTLSGQNGANGPATGDTSISISGPNFGASDYTPNTIVGRTVCDTLWMSDTLVVCKTRPGVGKDVDVSVWMQGAQTGTFTKAYTYDAPFINSVADPNGPGTGGNTISMSGSNFGSSDYSAGLSVGCRYPIKAQSSLWVSDTMLLVKMPSGGGVNFDVIAVIVDRMCTLTRSYSYDAPVISQINQFVIHSGSVSMKRGNSPQGGGANPIVFGKNFGSFDLTLQVRIGGTKAISSSWTSDSSLSIVTAPGVDTSATVNVYLDGVYDATLSRAFTFDGPRITAIVPHSSPAGSTITILGENMGVYDTSFAITVGDTACEAVVWQSFSGIVCKTPPGLGRSIPVTGSFVSGAGCDEGTCFQNFNYLLCEAGKYSEQTAAAYCMDCGPGKYGVQVGASSEDTCINCTAGSHSNSYTQQYNSSQCWPCEAGKFSNSSGSSSCRACQPGKYGVGANFSKAIGDTDCSTCAAGKYGMKSYCACFDYLTWFFMDDYWSWYNCQYHGWNCGEDSACTGECFVPSTCVACPPNTDSPPGSLNIANCSCKAGWSNYRFTFKPFPSQDYNATCMQCEAGKFKSVTTIPVCIECAAGTYAAREGATACTTCERGKYSAGGADMCTTFVAAETSECKCCAAVEQLGSEVERLKQKVTPRSSFIPTDNRTMQAWGNSGYSRCQLPFSWTQLHKVLNFLRHYPIVSPLLYFSDTSCFVKDSDLLQS